MRRYNFAMDKQRNLFSLQEINPIVRLLIISDFFLLGAMGLITPIFALFITDFIAGATVETVGIAATIYLMTRSLGQLPFGILIDKICGQRDDVLILILSSFGFIIVALSFIFIETVLQLYIVQFVYGLVSAASYPTWYALFTRAVDPGREGFEWSAYQTMIDFGGAITAAVGAFVAAEYGFQFVFILMAFLYFLGSMALIWVGRIVFAELKSKNNV